MNDLVKEKNQLEQEMREIYDKRESVAQWEAQISEIIKWWVISYLYQRLSSGELSEIYLRDHQVVSFLSHLWDMYIYDELSRKILKIRVLLEIMKFWVISLLHHYRFIIYDVKLDV